MDSAASGARTKRSAEAVDEPKKRRQLPVSCYFCRQKKLKCDRNIPCETCIKRGLQDTCVPAAVVESGAEPPVSRIDNNRAPAKSSSSTDLPLTSTQTPLAGQTSGKSELEQSNEVEAQRKGSAVEFFDRAAVGHEVLFDSTEQTLSDPIVSEIVLSIAAMLYSPKQSTVESLNTKDVFNHMPPLSLALRLLDHFSDKVAWTFALVHPPSIRTSLIELYKASEATETVDAPRMSLVAAVLALSAHFHSPSLAMEEHVARYYTTRLLDIARRSIQASTLTRTPTLAAIQATVLLIYYLLPNTNPTPDITVVASMLASLCARAFRMHQLDLPINKERRAREGCNHVEVELMRRIWWALASTEWLYSDNTGNLRYSIHPRHFHVDIPAHADNAAIDADGVYSRPFSVPTDESYFILRLRLAGFARDVVDACAEAGCASRADLDYETVMLLDAKMQTQWNEGPDFYRIDEESLRATEALRRERPVIILQTFVAHIGFHSRLSQLHRPYLARAMKDPRFAYSRTVSLQSARMAIYLAKQMFLSNLDCSPRLLQMTTATKNLFLSILVLAMDYHFNNKDPALREEIVQACKTLERMAAESTIARRGFHQLQSILDEWKQNSKGLERTVTQQQPAIGTQNSIRFGDQKQSQNQIQNQGLLNAMNPDDLSLADFDAQNGTAFGWLDFDSTLEPLDWENLFRHFENS